MPRTSSAASSQSRAALLKEHEPIWPDPVERADPVGPVVTGGVILYPAERLTEPGFHPPVPYAGDDPLQLARLSTGRARSATDVAKPIAAMPSSTAPPMIPK